jgi:acetoin utilization deacetylase AcuC-like enzyme
MWPSAWCARRRRRKLIGMKVFFSERMVAQSGSFSPSAGKPILCMRSWEALGIPLDVSEPVAATVDELCLAHDRAYVLGVLEGRIENGFGNTREDVRASLPFTTGAMLTAARWAIAHHGWAVAPCSGFHHAAWNRSVGFCTFNGLVVTAMALRNEGAKRVGILDFDEHYGDGTDAILRKLGIDFVTHVTAGAHYCRPAQATEFLSRIETWVDSMSACDVILYQAGADPHIDDPLGGWLTTAQLRDRDARVFAAARERRLPLVWNLAGGYQTPIRKVLDIHDNTAREHHAHERVD